MSRILAGLFLALSITPVALMAAENSMVEGTTWAEISGDIVGDSALKDGSALMNIDAPYRAEDAAIVPVVIEQTDTGQVITALKIVVDENPSPVVGEFRFGPDMHPLKLETRVRVNQYSNLRVIADTDQGSFMAGRFVKASGGCSAPATKDPVVAMAGLGEMRLKLFASAQVQQSTPRREAQIMIRHPNYSGLQRDQITQLFIPAFFIHELEVYQGDDLLFALEGGISLSENPVFRFDYSDNGARELRVRAVDTDGNVFERMLPKEPSA